MTQLLIFIYNIGYLENYRIKTQNMGYPGHIFASTHGGPPRLGCDILRHIATVAYVRYGFCDIFPQSHVGYGFCDILRHFVTICDGRICRIQIFIFVTFCEIFATFYDVRICYKMSHPSLGGDLIEEVVSCWLIIYQCRLMSYLLEGRIQSMGSSYGILPYLKMVVLTARNTS